MPVYLGFDASTQSLTVVAIEVAGGRCQVVLERALDFDAELPHYGTRHGVLPDADPHRALSPPLMWAEALDLVMAEVATNGGLDLADIRAVSGAAQQHGSVFLAGAAAARFGSLDPRQRLVGQLDGVFSRSGAPVWLDSSTTEACSAITTALGGPAAVAALTGSRCFERFTGPQIRSFAQAHPEAWARTARVHLVSSFMASLLSGAHAPLDPGDASGMNLMDIRAARWAAGALAATADGLGPKLPRIVPSWTTVGTLAPFWQERYGYPAARVIVWTGDNPSSLVGLGLVREGTVGVSLGTSDTVFAFMSEPRIDPSLTGHVFGAPTGGWMGLTCFANGSLARERVRDAFGLDWPGFSSALRGTPPGNRGGIMLPWFEPEITPTVHRPGILLRGIDPDDPAANVRAVVEAQMLAIVRHSAWMGVKLDQIYVTGGAAANREVLQVLADVSGAAVVPMESGHAAALGGALRAWHADALAAGHAVSWSEIVAAIVRPGPADLVSPRPQHAATYADLERVHAAFEDAALADRKGPAPPVRQ